MGIREKSLKYLAHYSRTSGQVRKHLLEKGFTEEQISAELEFLREMRYIDDTEYVRQYARQAYSKGKSIRKIRMELKERGVERLALESLDDIEDDESKADERARALKQAEKILEGEEIIDERAYARTGRRLVALGYEGETIFHVLGVLMKRPRRKPVPIEEELAEGTKED